MTDPRYDAVAAEFDPYIAKWIDKPFTGELLENCVRWEREIGPVEIRSLAVCAVDTFHGFTCEFSSAPRQHQGEYDSLEEILTAHFPEGLP